MKYCLSACLFFFAFSLGAQPLKIETSLPFSAMNCYKSRVVQCSNGNTFLINFKKNGCDLFLFNKERKLVKRAPMTGRLAGAGEGNDSYVSAIFETDTTLSFFLNQKIGGKPTMFRTVVSSTTGNIIDDTKIAELSKPKRGSGWAQVFGRVYADISVESDPVSGNYAIISYDGFAEDTASRLQINLYSAAHKQLWSAAYNKLAPEHKYLEALAAIVKDDKVLLCTHEWTTRSYGTEESILVMSEITGTEKIKQQRKLDVDPGLKDASVSLLYAPAEKKIMMCMSKRDGTFKQNYERYKMSVSSINEQDFSIAYTRELSLDALDEYSRKNCSKRKDFGGSFGNWMLNGQGNPRLLLSEFLISTTVSGSAYSSLATHVNTAAEIGDIGIVQLDKDGNQANNSNYVVAHAEVSGSTMRPRVMNNSTVIGAGFREEPRFLYENLASDEFAGCDYIHTATRDYVIYNIDRKEVTQSICDGIAGNRGNRSPAALYTITDGGQKRDYLFAAPGDDEIFRSAVMKSSSYLVKTQTYAVVMTEQHDRKMVSRLAWIQF